MNPAELAYLRTPAAIRERAEAMLKTVLADFNKLFVEEVAKYRTDVRAKNVVLFPENPPL